MVININPNYIPSQRPATGRPQERKRDNAGVDYKKPSRVEENFIPEPESLATIIRSAIASFRQGIVWDRGTILNVIV